MKLFASGCSFTWGGELFKLLWDDDRVLLDEHNTGLTNLKRLNVTWPGQLSKIGNFSEFHNHSMGCGSNNRIIRKTLDFFTNKISNNEDLSDWVAIIQWTEPNRFEFFDERSNSWGLVKNEVVLTENLRIFSSKEKDEILSGYFWNHDKAWNQKMFTEIVTLGSFFEKHNIKYFFTSLNNITLTDDQKRYCNNFIWYNGDIEKCSISAMHDIDQCEHSVHPSETGHRQLGEKFFMFLKNKYQL